MPTKPLPPEDLHHILTQAETSFRTLQNARIFLTGGTGFFGHWLLESLLHANRELSLNLHATVLTRNAAAFRAKSPHIANNPSITLLEGDIANFAFPTQPHTHILHAATDSGGQQSNASPEDLAESILAGTRHVLDFAKNTGATRLLYTSTGAVYGRSTTLLHTPETFPRIDLPPHSYEAAKRAAEDLCLTHPELNPVLARCFAFVGPHLPLDAHFAIGNFLGAALHNQKIHIKGDGTPRRSWLYMADLAIWLWTLLTHGQPSRAYNVGSDEGMTIAEAAYLVQKLSIPEPVIPEGFVPPKDLVILSEAKDLLLKPSPQPPNGSPNSSFLSSRSEPEGPAAKTTSTLEVQIDGIPNPTAPLNSYVPDITRAQTELGLEVTISLTEALSRSAAWYR